MRTEALPAAGLCAAPERHRRPWRCTRRRNITRREHQWRRAAASESQSRTEVAVSKEVRPVVVRSLAVGVVIVLLFLLLLRILKPAGGQQSGRRRQGKTRVDGSRAFNVSLEARTNCNIPCSAGARLPPPAAAKASSSASPSSRSAPWAADCSAASRKNSSSS